MTTITAETRRDDSAALTWGVNLMTVGAVAFIGYAVIFYVLNFTDIFLELGIGSDQVASGKVEIKAFDNDLYHYISHLHIAVSGFIAATGIAVCFLIRYGVRRGLQSAPSGAGVGSSTARPSAPPSTNATSSHRARSRPRVSRARPCATSPAGAAPTRGRAGRERCRRSTRRTRPFGSRSKR